MAIFHFWVERCQKYASHQKKLQIKVVRNWISPEKVRKRICLSFPGVELGGSKDWQVQNIIMYRNSKLHLIQCSMLPKIRMHEKKLPIKVVWHWISSKKVRYASVYLPRQWSYVPRKILTFFWCYVYFWQCFSYRIILQTCQSFAPTSSTPGGDRHMRPGTFLDEI